MFRGIVSLQNHESSIVCQASTSKETHHIVGYSFDLLLKSTIFRRLPGITFRKLKISPNVAYVSFQSLDDTLKAVELLNNFEFRGKLLAVRRCAAEKEFVAPTVSFF